MNDMIKNNTKNHFFAGGSILLKEYKILLCLLLACICLVSTSCNFDHVRQENIKAETIPPITEDYSAEPAESTAETTEPAEKKEQSAIPEIRIRLIQGANTTEYRPAEYRFIDKDGRELSVNGKIKIRGNSTAGGTKKPFNIKLERKISAFGMERDKHWVLLANLYDKTSLRNKMALDFAETLSFDYTTDCMYVNVYLNNIYQGMYLLCEDISVSEKRVDIDPSNGDYLIELESVRVDPGEVYVTTATEMRFKVKEPDPEVLTEKQLMELRQFLIDCDLAAASRDFEKISALFDVDSFVDYYVFSEVFKNVDGKYSSFYFYIKDGKIYAGPVWDYDLCCGNASRFYPEDKYQSYHNAPGQEGTGSGDSADGIWMQFGWFQFLMKCEEFQTLVTERYHELYPQIKNLFLDNELGQNKIDRLTAEYADVIEQNNELWDVSVMRTDLEWLPTFQTYEDTIVFYRNWFIRRITFLNEYFGVEDELPPESEYGGK